MPKSKKLLIRLSSAGDVLLTSPLVRLIKDREPNSEVHFVVKAQFADLVRFNPNIDVVHIVQDHATVYQLEHLRREFLRKHFDITLDLQNNFRSVYLRRGISQDIRVIRKEIFKRAILVKTKLNLFSAIRSVALKYAQTYDRSVTEVPRPEIFIPKEVQKKTDRLWDATSTRDCRTFFLCPGAKHFTKRWPIEYWRQLAEKISSDNQLALIGGETDKETCDEIGRGTGAVNFCGKLNLIESTAMLSHASVVVTSDSYLMHAANALGKNIVSIFGSSVRQFGFFPYGVNSRILEVENLSCRPCSHIGRDSCPKSHFRCMLDTKPDAVYDAARELLGK